MKILKSTSNSAKWLMCSDAGYLIHQGLHLLPFWTWPKQAFQLHDTLYFVTEFGRTVFEEYVLIWAQFSTNVQSNF
jgi:hypothetical protein